jgi:hypothetical protein
MAELSPVALESSKTVLPELEGLPSHLQVLAKNPNA